MKELVTKLLAVAAVLVAVIVALRVAGQTPALAAVIPVKVAEDPAGPPKPPEFECQSGCDCEVPKAGMVFCITDPQLCSVFSDTLDC